MITMKRSADVFSAQGADPASTVRGWRSQ